MLAAPVTAQSLDNQAFEVQVFHSSTAQPMQLSELSAQEMKETEGAVAPLVAIGVLHGGRFIAQRWVTQRVAAQALAEGVEMSMLKLHSKLEQ